MPKMPQDLENAIIEMERVKQDVADFINNSLPNLTISSDATETIKSIMGSLVAMIDGAVDALIVTDRMYRVLREIHTEEGENKGEDPS